MLLDGKLVSSSLIDDLKPRISYLHNYGITPKLNVILVGDDEGSKMYVTMKMKKCEELNILCNVIQFPGKHTVAQRFLNLKTPMAILDPPIGPKASPKGS